MFVLAIIGLLAVIATPNFIRYRNKARIVSAIADMKTIEKGIVNYSLDKGRLPDTLSDAGMGGLRDPWGHPYQYLKLPKMMGSDLAKRMKALNPDVRIIRCSGYSELIDVNSNSDIFNGYLSKPFSYEKLATIVRQTLDQ